MYSKYDHSFENPTYQLCTCTGKPNRWSTVDPCCIASTLTLPKIYLAKSELFKINLGRDCQTPFLFARTQQISFCLRSKKVNAKQRSSDNIVIETLSLIAK